MMSHLPLRSKLRFKGTRCQLGRLSGVKFPPVHAVAVSYFSGGSTRESDRKTVYSNKNNEKDTNRKLTDDDTWTSDRVNAYVGHSFPDFIEFWNRTTFKRVGYGLNIVTALGTSLTAFSVYHKTQDVFVAAATTTSLNTYPVLDVLSAFIPAGMMGAVTAWYWIFGLRDINQSQHAVRRNYPLLGNVRYILETIRPELNQYIVESDAEGRPFNRLARARVYQRAKNVNDTLPFGTRGDLSENNTEWICHSMYPKEVDPRTARHIIGNSAFGTSKPYSSSILNISGMSHGAISANAIVALNRGAKVGNFYHNTGEGGVSRYHREGGGNLVWNIGTGYFGCGSGSSQRVFEPTMFQETIHEANGQIKMIEVKLSQGAKPGHGGLLPKSKITKEIAETRKLAYPPISDCHSPVRHSAFNSPHELVQFLASLRELSGGLPVGIKLCVGQPSDLVRLCKAINEMEQGPDFITVDGGEGGTGAAPPEFSDYVGAPLEDGLVVVRNILMGANLKDKISLISSGKVSSGFNIVHCLALGANVCNSARGFMFSLGCIQALKCNTNRCPTGIATQDENLMFGLDPSEKFVRVYNFQSKTVKSACDIAGAMGCHTLKEVSSHHVMRRVSCDQVLSLAEIFPTICEGSFHQKNAPTKLQSIWDSA